MNIIVWKLSTIAAQKKVFFFTFFGLLRFSVFFTGLFAPTSRSWMSNIFRDSESLGKSNGKKWSQIWTFLFENCLKSPQKKKFFFFTFFGLLWFSVFFNGLFAPTSRGRMSNIFKDSEFLGKSNGKKWSNIWTFLFGSGLKLPRKKKVFFLLILPWSTLLWHLCYYPHRSRDALSSVCGIFVKYIQTSRLRVFIVSFGALISHKKYQHDSSTPSWSKFEIELTIRITVGNEPENRISLKKTFLMVLVQIWDHFSIVM